MKKFINSVEHSIQSFAKDEDGAQVVEYALIIAVVSIGLVVALSGATSGGLKGSFNTLITRVTACFTANTVCN
ncbi:Flp family type IVb pilin [Collimonas antrihumi]|uniref:Flp family type IVb pilin n=1 Tax=Collimonas antrihumi TaxID=1940615 RepID=UPI001B8D6F86|nr:Flp family type IVb pilin [Collimonas antrihumi]